MEKSSENKLASAQNKKKLWGRLFWLCVAIAVIFRLVTRDSNGGAAVEIGYLLGGLMWVVYYFKCRGIKKKLTKGEAAEEN